MKDDDKKRLSEENKTVSFKINKINKKIKGKKSGISS